MSAFTYRIAADGTATRVEHADAAADPAALSWIHLSTTAEDAQSWLRDAAHLAGPVIEALTAAETRPRCEAFEEGALLNLRGRSSEELASSDPLASVRIWATHGRVISVTRKPLVVVPMVEREVEAGRILDPGDLITAFATAITTDLDPLVADLGDTLDDCEESLDANQIFELRRHVTRVRKDAINYRRFIAPQRQAIERLAALRGDWLDAADRQHLAAAADRAARMAEELEAIRERASLTHEALTDLRAEQLDSRGLLISAVAMVFLPLTFITGLYGMNVEGLPYAQRPWAFDAIAGLCVLIVVGVVGWFVRQRWFRG
ncbi:MAG TPA: CorA family divalent cation transporter [Sphingomonas sp.]|jgi:zinc transporter